MLQPIQEKSETSILGRVLKHATHEAVEEEIMQLL